jgi:hypothetical protein
MSGILIDNQGDILHRFRTEPARHGGGGGFASRGSYMRLTRFRLLHLFSSAAGRQDGRGVLTIAPK